MDLEFERANAWGHDGQSSTVQYIKGDTKLGKRKGLTIIRHEIMYREKLGTITRLEGPYFQQIMLYNLLQNYNLTNVDFWQ